MEVVASVSMRCAFLTVYGPDVGPGTNFGLVDDSDPELAPDSDPDPDPSPDFDAHFFILALLLSYV